MGRGADQPPSELRPWPSPDGGYERVLKPDRAALRKRPLRRWEIVFLRVLLLVEVFFAAPGLWLAPPLPSLWRAAAMAVGMSALSCVAGTAVGNGPWLLQLVGLRPPAE